jgi:hypothetical protein
MPMYWLRASRRCRKTVIPGLELVVMSQKAARMKVHARAPPSTSENTMTVSMSEVADG